MKHRKHLLKICVLLSIFVCASLAPSAFAQGRPPSDIEQKIGVGLKVLTSHGAVAGINARYWTDSNFGLEGGWMARGGWNVIPISALYTMSHFETNDLYIRPYVGGGLNLNRWSSARWYSYWGTRSYSESSIGGQGFVGVEFTARAFPRLSFGSDLGIHSFGYGNSFALGINVLYYVK